MYFLMPFDTSRAVLKPKELHLFQKVLGLSAYLQETGNREQRNVLNDAIKPEGRKFCEAA